MSKKEDFIEEEIRRRALERAFELKENQEQLARKEANLEALESVAELPREELERIDQEVRAEMSKQKGRQKIALIAIAVSIVICICLALFLFSDQKMDEKGELVSTVPDTPKKPDTRPSSPSPKTEVSIPPKDRKPVFPEQTGPILPKTEAEKVLKEPLLDCLKETGQYAMIVRIGQGYDAPSQGPLAPLIVLRDEATINYRDVYHFTETPLGKCVNNAAMSVRTRAFKGNYMRFSLTNEDVPDPLAGAPKTIDRKEAEQALSALDEEARECSVRFPQYAEPGKRISFSIRFRGVDGSVTEVLPFYVKDSPYCNCLKETYKKVTVTPFRRLSEKVLHKLTP